VEQTADGVCITDRHGVIEYVNPAFERLLGFAGDQIIGSTPALFASGAEPAELYQGLWRQLLAGEVFRRVFIDRRADGELIHLDETITPIKDAEGHITHFVASARDVTPRVRTEEVLRRVNESLELQARSIAQALHDEAGQILTSAHIAMAEAARNLSPDSRSHLEEVRRHLDGIEVELRRLAHELRPRMLDELGLVAALDFLARGFGQRTGIVVGLATAMTRRLAPHVETLVYRVVQEALTNAGRHAAASRVDIAITERSAHLHCRITDDGQGFDPAAVLQPGGCAGLGLRGFRDRLQAIGGMLEIASAPGRGTEISFTIPLEA
jgi:PAS domain S-box-containing protein